MFSVRVSGGGGCKTATTIPEVDFVDLFVLRLWPDLMSQLSVTHLLVYLRNLKRLKFLELEPRDFRIDCQEFRPTRF